MGQTSHPVTSTPILRGIFVSLTFAKTERSGTILFRSIPHETAKPYLLAEGDLLFARSGATVGKTFKYHPSWGKAAYAGYLIRARPGR